MDLPCVEADAAIDAGELVDPVSRGTKDALERLVADTGAASADDQERTREAWRRAAHRTPHGHPIDLRPDDFI